MEKTVIILLLLLHVAVGSPVNDLSLGDKLLSRPMRGIKDWKIFAKSSTKAPPTTTKPPILPNNLEFGNCEEDDKVSFFHHHFYRILYTNFNYFRSSTSTTLELSQTIRRLEVFSRSTLTLPIT